MRIAILYPSWLLGFRGHLDLADVRRDPRGLTGSELAFLRIGEELAKAGWCVHLYTASEDTEYNGCRVFNWDAPRQKYDVTLSINSPDDLRGATGFRVCYFLINNFTICHEGFQDHVDLWLSPSHPHLDQVLTNPAWRCVEMGPEYPEGRCEWTPDASKWQVVPLGCDPEHCDGVKKVPGRVIYASSPDRGLHWLLQEWPAIKRAVPHAHLRIFYRLKAWVEGFDSVPYYPPIEPLRRRALYIAEALRRLQGPEWGVEVYDSVSRERIEREMAEAEVLAYPCDTVQWSEGFSCTVLEACAARACPIITDCDALGDVYGGSIGTTQRGDMGSWRARVIEALTDTDYREATNERARALAERHTWRLTAKRILEAIEQHTKGQSHAKETKTEAQATTEAVLT